jgi:hypothetical protein
MCLFRTNVAIAISPAPEYTVTGTGDNVMISGTGTFLSGTSITIDATPATGYTITGATITDSAGTTTSITLPYTFTVIQNVTINVTTALI